MQTKLGRVDLVFKVRFAILLLEIAFPFVLYYALQSGYSWLATICLAVIMLVLIGVVLIQ